MKNTSKNSYFILLISFVVAASLVGTPAYAQDRTSEIDKIFSWATPDTPGCAVAVSQHGKPVVNRAYGSAELEHGAAITPSTISRPGSVAKQFTAASVLLLVEEGRLSLSDDVRKYIPELPDYGHKITVDHLLTHTSGIRDWTHIVALAGSPRGTKVYSTADALNVILRQRSLNFAPGEEFAYSNSGFDLLAQIIERVSGLSAREFTRKRLLEPLGMKATHWPEDFRDVVKNRALAYEKEGDRWKLGMLFENHYHSAMLSTTGDLLIWNEALTGSRLGAFVTEKLQEQARLNNGRQLKYARGLIVESYRGFKEVWHSGGSAGYHSWLGRYPEQGLSIAMLCNSDAVSTTVLAHCVIDQFLPPKGAETAGARAPAATTDGAGAAGLDVSSKEGLFVSERTGETLRLIANKGELRIPGARAALMPVTKDRFRHARGDLFFMSQDEFELHFLSPDRFELKSMEGQTTLYRRAQPFAPTSAELLAFAGRYESDETGSAFEMVPGKDGLVIHLVHSSGKGSEIKPVYRDTFQRGLSTVRFRRDKDGKVVAFDYSNPVLRNVRFTRLSDRTRARLVRPRNGQRGGGRIRPPAPCGPGGRSLLDSD